MAVGIHCIFSPFNKNQLGLSFFFFFNDTATTEIYTLSLHDALPILIRLCCGSSSANWLSASSRPVTSNCTGSSRLIRSEEHTSELQSPCNLVCRLLLEKKNWSGGVQLVDRTHRPRCYLRSHLYSCLY